VAAFRGYGIGEEAGVNAIVDQLLPALPPLRRDEVLVDAVFDPTRGVPHRSQWGTTSTHLPPFLGRIEADQERVRRNVVRYRVAPDRWVESASIPMLSQGEPSEFVKYVLRDRTGRVTRILQRPFHPGLQQLVTIACPECDPDDPALEIDARAYIDEVKSELKKPGSNRKLQRFFARLNLHTSVTLWERLVEQAGRPIEKYLEPKLVRDWQEMQEMIGGRMSVLYGRLAARVSGAPSAGQGSDPDMQEIVRVQATLFRSLSAALLEEAFEKFANGELRLPLPRLGAIAVQPSSGFYFLWGEFWMLAHELGGLGVDRDQILRWAKLLVRTQEIYALSYAPTTNVPVGQRNTSTYSANNFVQSSASPAFIDGLRGEYRDFDFLELSERFCLNVRSHLRGL
jgi:hypothetical protein